MNFEFILPLLLKKVQTNKKEKFGTCRKPREKERNKKSYKLKDEDTNYSKYTANYIIYYSIICFVCMEKKSRKKEKKLINENIHKLNRKRKMPGKLLLERMIVNVISVIVLMEMIKIFSENQKLYQM